VQRQAGCKNYQIAQEKTICHDKAFVKALRKAFDLPLVKKAS
jgi:hypothetical protein